MRNMGSSSGDNGAEDFTRSQLLSSVDQMRRQNDCLKTDLLRYELLSNKCLNYIQFLKTNSVLSQTIDTSIDRHFIKQINDLKDIHKCFVYMNQSPVNFLNASQETQDNGSKCGDCGENVAKKGHFVCHYENCQRVFKFLKSFQKHLNSHPNGKEVKTGLGDKEPLNDTVIDIIATESHELDNNNGYEFVCNFANCGQVFQSQIPFKRHQSWHSKYVCGRKKCDKTFKYWRYLRRHQKTAHPEDEGKTITSKPYVCDHQKCGQRFKSQIRLDLHQKSVHRLDGQKPSTTSTTNKPYVCNDPKCGKAFEHMISLRRHQLSHSGQRYYCDYDNCCRHFANQTLLLAHKAVAHGLDQLMVGEDVDGGNDYGLITAIGEQHTQDIQVSNHTSGYFKNTDNSWIKCQHNGCDYKTRIKSGLHQHMKSHSTGRQYKCLVGNCGKTYKWKQSLTNHHLVAHPIHLKHSSDKCWHSCPHTGCQFKSKSTHIIVRHIDTHFKSH